MDRSDIGLPPAPGAPWHHRSGRRHWVWPAVAALLAACPAVVAWAVFGPLIVEDSHAYLDYAGLLRAGAVASGPALLHEGPVPVTLFRMGGYPAILALLQGTLAGGWLNALLLLQIGAQAAVAAASYGAARALGIRPALAMGAAVLPSVGFAVVLQICVLSDALCGALMSGAALVLIIRPRLGGAVIAGSFLALATTMREATLFVALGYLPLACGVSGPRSRRWASAAAIVLLPCCVGAAQIGWNVARQAGPVLTTSRQTVMIQAVLPLVGAGYPVFAGEDVFDATARATVGIGGYREIDEMHRRLFAAGMTAPDMAALASQRYQAAWRQFPWAMARATLQNLRFSYLALPLEPMETASDLVVFAGGTRPAFAHMPAQWTRLRRGDLLAAPAIVLDLVTHLVGVAITLAAIAGPWLLPRAWRLRALWCACAGLIAVYLPVHIEPRYIVPVVPLVCLLAAATAENASRILTLGKTRSTDYDRVHVQPRSPSRSFGTTPGN